MTSDGPREPEIPRSVRPFVDSDEGFNPSAFEPAPGSAGGRPPGAGRIRPYLLTGGRAGSQNLVVEIEAQVLTTRLGRGAVERHTYEHRDILLMCDEPMA